MSYELLKCLINRTEKHSKFVATGDAGQSDIVIKQNSRCGLKMILDGIEYKRHTEDKSMENNSNAVKPNDPDYVTIAQLDKTMKVIELKHAIRNPDGHKVRQWLDQIPDDLKEAAKLVKTGQITAVQDTKTTHNMVPVFSAFAGWITYDMQRASHQTQDADTRCESSGDPKLTHKRE
jgi:hypothetical protein